jgi:hypothetical protein
MRILNAIFNVHTQTILRKKYSDSAKKYHEQAKTTLLILQACVAKDSSTHADFSYLSVWQKPNSRNTVFRVLTSLLSRRRKENMLELAEREAEREPNHRVDRIKASH